MAKSADGRPMKREWLQGIYETSATRREHLGALRIDDIGRKFRYAKAGAVALAAGYPQISLAPVANHSALTPSVAAAIGDTTVYITLGGTAATADYYEDGYLVVAAGTGIGHMYRIDSNEAQTATAGVVTIHLAEPIRVAWLVADTKIDLVNSIFRSLVVSTAVTDFVAGVSVTVVPINHYFWIQTGGPAPCIATTEAHGTQLAAGAAVGIEITAWTDNILGPIFGTGNTGDAGLVALKID